MKLSKTYLFVVALAVLLLFVLQLQQPRRYNWTATFGPADCNPFGCYVMDSVLRASMPRGYRVTDSTVYQLSHGSMPRNVLVLASNLKVDAQWVEAVERITRQGGKLMIVGSVDDSSADSLMLKHWGAKLSGYNYFSVSGLKAQLAEHYAMLTDTLTWASDGHYRRADYVLYRMMLPGAVDTLGHAGWQTLAYNDENSGTTDYRRIIMAARRRMGEGELILVAVPLVLTNYGMLDRNTSDLVMRLMTQLADRPVVRTLQFNRTVGQTEQQQSPFRVLLQSRPLTWAFYLSLLTIVLFFIFTARRRQRVIQVVEPPKNHSLEFVQLIGTLYYLRRDHAALVRTKLTLFADAVRRQTGLDILDVSDNDRVFGKLGERTGMAYEDIARTIKALRYIQANENNITEHEMKAMVGQMDEILYRL